MSHTRSISVVGLGYVGLPVAAAFAAAGLPVVAHDIDPARIAELCAGLDRTGEVAPEALASPHLRFTLDPDDLWAADFHIVTVPTPITETRQPDFRPLLSASRAIGRRLKRGDVVVYESTVYPGATEEVCVPVLEAESGLRLGADFTVGYSPERINPGDRAHRFETITKVVSGSDARTLEIVAAVYGSVARAGVHRAPSIKVAEAAKVIENTQRDLNIALMNEIALIFDRLGIRTRDVLEAAGTKWNFLRFSPGLVGGHCIGVDPYYLTAKAEAVGYHPQVILAGRRINDGMGRHVAQRLVKMLAQGGHPVRGARVGVLGLTFKENVPDLRNSRVPDILGELREYGIEPVVHDPMADPNEAAAEYGVELAARGELAGLHAVVLAVPHAALVGDGPGPLAAMLAPGGVVVDVKSTFGAEDFPDRAYWSL
jgi:UDP-N-acetyl-D-galactosamine dehydrogenase